MFVGDFAAPGVDNDGAVVAAVELLSAIAVFEERCDYAVELPRRGGTGGIEVLPADVDLERGFFVSRQECLVTRQAHQALVVVDDGGGRRFQNRDSGSCHVSSMNRHSDGHAESFRRRWRRMNSARYSAGLSEFAAFW